MTITFTLCKYWRTLICINEVFHSLLRSVRVVEFWWSAFLQRDEGFLKRSLTDLSSFRVTPYENGKKTSSKIKPHYKAVIGVIVIHIQARMGSWYCERTEVVSIFIKLCHPFGNSPFFVKDASSSQPASCKCSARARTFYSAFQKCDIFLLVAFLSIKTSGVLGQSRIHEIRKSGQRAQLWQLQFSAKVKTPNCEYTYLRW